MRDGTLGKVRPKQRRTLCHPLSIPLSACPAPPRALAIGGAGIEGVAAGNSVAFLRELAEVPWVEQVAKLESLRVQVRAGGLGRSNLQRYSLDDDPRFQNRINLSGVVR